MMGKRIICQSVFVVQSVSMGELFVNKLLERVWNPTTQLSLPPLELRASTYRYGVGDTNIDLTVNNQNNVHRKGILPNITCFNTLRFWQELDPSDPTNPNCTVYSLYFDWCNGGSIRDLIDAYRDRALAIPEHFIWHVAEQLFLALVTMKFGSHTNNPPDNWAKIYHRDLHAANIFLNYPPRGPGRIPKAGIEGNAFPEIIVGDFGSSGIEGDDLAILPYRGLGAPTGGTDADGYFLEDWDDIYQAGQVLREMSMTHIPTEGAYDDRPDNRWVQACNDLPTAPPYTDGLIELLQRFEYPNMPNTIVRDLLGAVHTTFPSPEEICDTLLPLARIQVAGFRKPDGNIPAGYFNDMDVSWTRPGELLPFNYTMKYATNAGDGPDGGPPPESDGGDSGGDQSEGGSGDDGDDGDVEMPANPQQPDEAAGAGGADVPAGLGGGDGAGDGAGGAGGGGRFNYDDFDFTPPPSPPRPVMMQFKPPP